MNVKKLPEKINELYKYYNVDIDKEFAAELIPIIELISLDVDRVKKIAKSELNFLGKLYVNYCEKRGKITSCYSKLMHKGVEKVRYKLINLLDALHDVVNENTTGWNRRWKIKSYHKLKYSKIRSTRFLGYELKVKPEYKPKQKENEKIKLYNEKQRKICYKWRDSNIKFYKKLLKIVK